MDILLSWTICACRTSCKWQWRFQPFHELPSGKLTWQWKFTFANRKYIFKWWIFHCYVSLPKGNDWIHILWSLQLNQESLCNPWMDILDFLQSFPTENQTQYKTTVKSLELDTLSSTIPRWIWKTTVDSTHIDFISVLDLPPIMSLYTSPELPILRFAVPVPVVWRVSVSFAPQSEKKHQFSGT